MAVLTNTMLQGTAADVGSGDYQIAKSLRWNSDDQTTLKRTPSTIGSRRRWTWSGWVKRNLVESNQSIWSIGTSSTLYGRLMFYSSHYLHYSEEIGGTTVNLLTTNKLFLDPTAWYHIVIAVDTQNVEEAGRAKMYVNGKLITEFSETADYADAGEITAVNSTTEMIYGYDDKADSYRPNLQLADVQFIDGLQLSPACFAEEDAAGNWNPKEFALTQVNKGATLSSSLVSSTGSYYSGDPATDAFNGLLSNFAGSSSGAGDHLTFTVPSHLNSSGHLWRVYTNKANKVEFDGKELRETSSTSSHDWFDCGYQTVSTIKITSGTTTANLWAIECDGILLVDGQIDPETRDNSNENTDWTSKLSGPGLNGGTKDNIFDGANNTIHEMTSASNYTFTHTFTNVESLRVYGYAGSAAGVGACDIAVNGSGATAPTTAQRSTNCWVDLPIPVGGTVTSIKWTRHSASGGEEFDPRMIEVNGHVLVDNTVDNSYHLKFDDTSSNAAIGYDSFKTFADSSIKAINGAPILKTNITGDTVASGYRTDDNSSSLVLALPLNSANGVNDVHGSATGSSNLTCDAESGSENSTSNSKWYGSSRYFGSGDYIDYNDSSLVLGTGDYTVECWCLWDDAYGGGGVQNRNYLWDMQQSGVSSAKSYQRLFLDGTGGSTAHLYTMDDDGSDSSLSVWNSFPKNEWVHVAQVRASGTIKTYVNGIERHSHTFTENINAGQFNIGGSEHGGFGSWSGFIQDFKVYTSAVYTAPFTPVSRNDFTAANFENDDGTSNFTTTGYTVTKDGSLVTQSDLANAFDGDTTTYSNLTHNNNTWTVLTFRTALTGVTKLRVWCSGTGPIGYNGGSQATMSYSSGGEWKTLLDGASTTINSIRGETQSGNGVVRIYAIEVNDTILTDTKTWANNDVLNDSPTNYEDDTGGIHGNYCTLNYWAKGSNLSFKQGNLDITGTSGTTACCLGTMGVSSGKWYYEFTFNNASKLSFIAGVTNRSGGSLDQVAVTGDYAWHGNGNTWHDVYSNGSAISDFSGDGPTAAGDVIGVLLDFDNTTVTIKLNNSSKGNITTSLPAGLYYPQIGNGSGAAELDATINFGQTPFKYPQSGFKGWCTQSMDDLFSGDAINNPSKFFDVKTYVGTGASRDFKFNFGPDLIWTFFEGGSGSHRIYDQILGTGKHIPLDSYSTTTTEANNITAFNSDGYTMGTNGDINSSGGAFVSVNWDAGTAANTSNLDTGNVTPTAQWVNATAGLSISKVNTGSSVTAANFAHNLGAKPHFVIVINGTTASHKYVYYDAFSALNNYLIINIANDVGVNSSNKVWGNTQPTNTLFYDTFGDTHWGQNQDMVYYMWTEIPGFSKFGKYIGNGSASKGPMINCGFRPKWFMYKRDADSTNWFILDSAREPFNDMDDSFFANDNSAESSQHDLYFLSNGVRIASADGEINYNDSTYYYAAFAEHPFKTARAK